MSYFNLFFEIRDIKLLIMLNTSIIYAFETSLLGT